MPSRMGRPGTLRMPTLESVALRMPTARWRSKHHVSQWSQRNAHIMPTDARAVEATSIASENKSLASLDDEEDDAVVQAMQEIEAVLQKHRTRLDRFGTRARVAPLPVAKSNAVTSAGLDSDEETDAETDTESDYGLSESKSAYDDVEDMIGEELLYMPALSLSVDVESEAAVPEVAPSERPSAAGRAALARARSSSQHADASPDGAIEPALIDDDAHWLKAKMLEEMVQVVACLQEIRAEDLATAYSSHTASAQVVIKNADEFDAFLEQLDVQLRV